MAWGRNVSGSSKASAVSSRSTANGASPVPVAVAFPLDEAQRRAQEATEAIRNADIVLKPPPKQQGQRKRAHSFSLPFFNAQRAAAKQEAQRQRKAAGGSPAVEQGHSATTPPLPPPPPMSPSLSKEGGGSASSSTLRFFPIRTGSRAAVTDIKTLTKGGGGGGADTAFSSRKQSMADDDDNDFACCGLSDAAFRTLLTSTNSTGHHRNGESTSSDSTVTTTTLSRSRASEDVDSDTSAASSASRADASFDVKRDSVGFSARPSVEGTEERAEITPSPAAVDATVLPATLHVEIQTEVDAIDVSELLDRTLMPAVMSPISTLSDADGTAAREAERKARHARSMPSLRVRALADEDKENNGRLSPRHAAAEAVEQALLLPFAGDLNALRLQLGPAMGASPAFPTYLPDLDEAAAGAPHIPERSPLRARRHKQPLSIEPSLDPLAKTPVLTCDRTPLSARSPLSPSTPTGGRDLGLALLRARRSKSSLKLAAVNSNISGPLSPPPCPPPCTPLPQIPLALAEGRSSTASDASDISTPPQLSLPLETQNPDFYVFGFAF